MNDPSPYAALSDQHTTVLAEIRATRADLAVLTAIARRIAGTVERLSDELRARRGCDTQESFP